MSLPADREGVQGSRAGAPCPARPRVPTRWQQRPAAWRRRRSGRLGWGGPSSRRTRGWGVGAMKGTCRAAGGPPCKESCAVQGQPATLSPSLSHSLFLSLTLSLSFSLSVSLSLSLLISRPLFQTWVRLSGFKPQSPRLGSMTGLSVRRDPHLNAGWEQPLWAGLLEAPGKPLWEKCLGRGLCCRRLCQVIKRRPHPPH